MYEVTCPTSGAPETLGHDRVLSSHRVRDGHVVYLRCSCGAVTIWTSARAHHPPGRPAATRPAA